VPSLLIHGIDSQLGCSCAARWLQSSDVTIYYVGINLEPKEITDVVLRSASQPRGDATSVPYREDIGTRLLSAGSISDVFKLAGVAPRINQAWLFSGPSFIEPRSERLEQLLRACPTIGIKEVNYVEVDSKRGGWKSLAGDTISQRCQEQNLRFRIFRTSLIVDEWHPVLEDGNGVFAGFLAALYSFKTEIEERCPQYFDFHALRCLAPEASSLNLLPASVASEMILRIADQEGTAGHNFPIMNPQWTAFSALCEHIAISFGIGLIPVPEYEALNNIDQAFHERIRGFHDYFACAPNIPAYGCAEPSNHGAMCDDEAQLALLRSVRQNLDKEWLAHEQRVARMPDTLGKKTIARNNSELTYYIAGTTGPVVVILNALGQRLEFWYRLIDILMKDVRLIIWEPRGTIYPPPPFGLAEQVNDLEAVLYNERIDSCYLLGWCTGPKVAVDFYLRRPEVVQSMVFLNSTFKCTGSEEELDTEYERHLEFLCRSVVRKPSLAASMMKTFQSASKEQDLESLEETDAEPNSRKVLSLINTKLKPLVLSPFANEETTLNYAHQLVDFWSNDVRPKAREVHAPVFLIGTEYDEVVSPAASEAAAKLFPNAKHVHILGATHYCLYDRAEYISGLLRGIVNHSYDQTAVGR
jgi:pimeloyl-ACP methyl ester carboxylesterase